MVDKRLSFAAVNDPEKSTQDVVYEVQETEVDVIPIRK